MKNIIIITIALSFGLFAEFGCTPKTIDKVKKPTPITSISQLDTSPISISNRIFSLEDNMPLDPNVRIGTLSNGMRYFIRKNAKPEKRAELRLAVNVGSMQENDEQRGLAHFVEHMAFNGTKHFKKNELVNYLESIGTKFGADLNAYTSFDETVYMLQIPTDDPKILNKGFLIMQDWASNISFDEEEIDKERGVVLSEWRTGLGAQERMRNQWFPVVFNGSRYAKRLPIGDPKIVENASYETIRSYYKKWYRPDMMAISIVGDFNLNEMEDNIKKRFGSIDKATEPLEKKLYEVPNHKAPQIAIVADKEATGTAIQMMYKHDHLTIKTVGDYRKSLMHEIYNGIVNERLDELTRSIKPPYIYAYSGYGNFVRTKDAYFSYILVPDNGIEAGLKTILKENKRVKTYGFTAAEFERQKEAIKNSIQQNFNEKDKTPSSRYVMTYIYHFLTNEPIPGVEYEKMLMEQMLPTIQLKDINTLADQWIVDNNQAIIITMPEKEGLKIPSQKELVAWMKAGEALEVTPPIEEVGIEKLMEQPTEKVAAKEVKKHESVDVTELVFNNGLKVAFKQTDFKNDEIVMYAFRKGGHSLYDDEDYMSAYFADNVTLESGIADYKAGQLEKYLKSKTVRVSPYVSELYDGFWGYSSVKDLEMMFQLIHLYFTNSNFDEDAATALVSKQIAQTKNQSASPRYQFYDELYQVLYQNHPRRMMQKESDYQKVDVKRAYEIFQERFSDANDFTFVFVGSFDQQKLTELTERYIGTLPLSRKATKAKWRDIGLKKASGKVERVVKKGEEPQSMVTMDFNGSFEMNTQNRYDFNSMISVLKIMLREAMREDKGGVYGVGVSPGLEREPNPNYEISISFTCAPKDVEDLVATAIAQIKKLQTEGPSAENIKKIQETQRRDFEQSLKKNSFWRNQISSIYRYDGEFSNILIYKDNYINKLDPAAVQKAAKNYIDTDAFVKVILYPEK